MISNEGAGEGPSGHQVWRSNSVVSTILELLCRELEHEVPEEVLEAAFDRLVVRARQVSAWFEHGAASAAPRRRCGVVVGWSS